MARIAHGQEAALSELYDRYCRLVLSVAYGVVHNRETAEEVTLDIFTSVWEKAAMYDAEQARVSTWLTRMARNRAIDQLRREAVRPSQHSVSWAEMPVEPVLDETNDLETAVHLNLERQRVRTAVASLSAQQQEALALAYFQGYSHSEIAQVLEQPLGTVKGRIRAGMQKLRDLLE
jgi:RNA polymerase sigma-70 factor (ECF subfamily)